MFDKEYSFRGKHASMVRSMVRQNDGTSKFSIFERNFDIYLVAPIIGFIYGERGQLDISTSVKTDIFPEILIKNGRDLKFNFQLIMLLDDKYEPLLNKRINISFINNSGDSNEAEKRYNEYVLGGVEIIYNKIVNGSISINDCLDKYYNFLEEFEMRYNNTIDTIEFEELVMLAKF